MKKAIFLVLLSMNVVVAAQTSKKDKLVKIKTPHGEMVLVLYDETPLHKANFLKLAEAGRYDSTIFHRVIKDFMIQGGDIYNKPTEKRGTDDDRVPAEILPQFFHHKGALAAARTNNPEKKSSDCQFYIVHGKVQDKDELTIDQNKLNSVFAQLLQEGKIDSLRDRLIELQKEKKFDEMNKLIAGSADVLEKASGTSLRKEISPEKLAAYSSIGGSPHLDGEYTVYGRVITGLEVIDKIATVQTNPGDMPAVPVHMTMEVMELPKKKITKLYGYSYPNSK